MNKIFSIIRKNELLSITLGVWALSAAFLASCTDNDSDAPENFYSSLRMTAAEVIKSDDSKYGMFREILTKANYLSMLSTYGRYTVFIPDNDAVTQYLQENGYPSLDSLPLAVCDTIARTHIVKTDAYFTTDIGGKPIQKNMNDRYVEFTTDSDAVNNNALAVYVNKRSRLIAMDDSVTNGVVHVVNRVISSSNQYLSDLMAQDTTISIFCEALRLTGLADSLTRYEDEKYTVAYDSTITSNKGWIVAYGSQDGGGSKQQPTFYPEKRYFKYTAFVEQNSVLRAAGINNLDDLKTYAKQVYDQSYPEDAGKYDKDFKDRRNPLNRFVSYHLINREGTYDHWVVGGDIYKQRHMPNVADPEDYFETMLPHSIMRFCLVPGTELYINRKGLKNVAYEGCPGIRVKKPTESGGAVQDAMNGRYHYIDGILTYDYKTRNVALNRRLRIDSSSLSPDFMNGGARVDNMGKNIMLAFKRGFLTDWVIQGETKVVGLRGEDVTWSHYEGQGVCITGRYDVSFKLPAVPFSGTYEIRMGYSVGGDRGAAQVYLNNEPCGIPVDFTGALDETGWEADWIAGADGSEEEVEEHNRYIDKNMRNKGFMKAMDSYGQGDSFRAASWDIRRILSRTYLDANQEYWLRLRSVVEQEDYYMSLDYIELVPKNIYDNPKGEDRH